MKICKIDSIPGPNQYCAKTVLKMHVDMEKLKDLRSNDPPAFNYQLLCTLPQLRNHSCSAERRTAFIDSIYRGASFQHVLKHVVLELSYQVQIPIQTVFYSWNGESTLLDFVVDSPKDEPIRAILATAVDLIDGITKWKLIPFSERMNEIKRLAY